VSTRALLGQHVFGKPALGEPELRGDDHRGRARPRRGSQYFNGTGEYTAVFTLNASGALKLIGESYPFEAGGQLLLTSTTTTRSTASASSRAPKAPGWTTRR